MESERPEPDAVAWARWRRWFPRVLGVAAALWIIVRSISMGNPGTASHIPGPIAQFHDFVVLPVALKAVYSQVWVLWLCSGVAGVSLILWPHGGRWPLVTCLVAAVPVAGWVILYDMMRNAPVSSFVAVGVVAYVLARYCWIGAMRILLLNGKAFGWIRSYVDANPRADDYYDAIRAVSTKAPGAAPRRDSVDFWKRLHSRHPAGKWARRFAVLARQYRNGTSRFQRRLLARVLARQMPGSLRNQWLWALLEHHERVAEGRFQKYECGSWTDWQSAMEALILATDAKVEYLAFDLNSVQTGEPILATAAGLYDQLARLAVTRQLWAANVAPAEPSPDDPDSDHQAWKASSEQFDAQWEELRTIRRALIQKASTLREMYVGVKPNEDLREQLNLLGVFSKSGAPVSAKAAHLLILAVSRFQTSILPGAGGMQDPQQPHVNSGIDVSSDELATAIGSAQNAPEADRPLVARKSLELAFDCREEHWAQEILELQLLPPPASQTDAVLSDTAFEGHLYWWMAKTTHTEYLSVSLYRMAVEAFLLAARPELELLKDEIRQRALLESEQEQPANV